MKISLSLALFMVSLFFFSMSQANSTVDTRDTLSEIEAFTLYDSLNTTDIALGTLALAKGTEAAISNLGEMIVFDHSKIQAESKILAVKSGLWQVSQNFSQPLTTYAEKIKRLESINKETFDKEYLVLEIDFSEFAIKTIEQSVLPAIDQEPIKSFLTATLQQMKSHIQHIYRAQKSWQDSGMPMTKDSHHREATHSHEH